MENSARKKIELLPDAVTQMKMFYKVSLNSQQDNTGAAVSPGTHHFSFKVFNVFSE